MEKEFKEQIAEYKEKINARKKRIKSIEDSYDSLTKFRNMVSDSDEEFESVCGQNSSLLNTLTMYSNRCEIAARYQNGMRDVLTGRDNKIINMSFEALLGLIKARLITYKAEIESNEAKIFIYNGKISELEKMIKLEKAAKRLF